MNKLTLAAAFAAAASTTASANNAHAQNPPICTMWRTTLSQCEVTKQLSNNSACTGSTPCTEAEENSGLCTGGNKIPWVDYLTYNAARYQRATDPGLLILGETQDETNTRRLCQRYADIMETQTSPNMFKTFKDAKVGVEIIDSTQAICLLDWNGNGIPEPGLERTNDAVLVNLEVDPECYLTPQGPYKDMAGGGNTPGGAFNVGDVDWKASMLNEQWRQRYPGPLYPVGYQWQPRIVSDMGTWRNPAWTPSPEGMDFYYILQKTDIYDEDAVEFDHIIPAHDSQGCRCGRNSNKNLQLVSRALNGTGNGGMGNNMRHPARREALKEWAGYLP